MPGFANRQELLEQYGIDSYKLTWTGGQRYKGGRRIEVALTPGYAVMRFSVDPLGPFLVFAREAWGRFVEGAKDGDFDDMLGEFE